MILPGHDPFWHKILGCKGIQGATSFDHLGEDCEIPPGAQQPASVDLRLGANYIVGDERIEARRYALAPGILTLGVTLESVAIPAIYQGQLNGKSTWARRGLLVHVTGGFIDPGFKGKITLEMLNVGPNSILLEEGMPIAQLSLCRMLYPVQTAHLYAGKYQDAADVEAAKDAIG